MTETDLKAGFEFLAHEGLNLQTILDVEHLAAEIRGQLRIKEGHSRILLLAHGGRTLWDRLEGKLDQADPVDRHSRSAAETFMTDYVGADFETLHPLGEGFVPLQALGRAAGWAHPSPVGLDITREFGLWFAYRVVVTTDADLPASKVVAGPSPCDSCLDKPCIDACPAGAVGVGGIDGGRCMTYRLSAESACADRCLARLACPVAPEHRYSLGQVQYHYGLSLETIRNWRDASTR